MNAIDPRPPARKSTWIALVLPPTAWALFEVGLAVALRFSCSTVGSWLGPVWGAASLLTCCGAMRLAWPAANAGDANDSPAGAWLAWIALMVAPLFGLAIAFQTLATFIVPPCAR
jgi:hypothetical protein